MAIFLEAANYTKISALRPRKIRLIVCHDMEAQERLDTAENVARYFQNKHVKASTHWNFDADSQVRSVADRHVAWAAPGANHDGLQYEHAGYANQTKGQWLDNYGVRMLHRSAKQAAKDCRKYKIKIRHCNVADLKAGGTRRQGITRHVDVTNAHHESTHTDPGRNFPLFWWIDQIEFYYHAVDLSDMRESFMRDRKRAKGLHPYQVRRVQKALGIVRTGRYGAGTRRAVRKEFPHLKDGMLDMAALKVLGRRGNFDTVS